MTMLLRRSDPWSVQPGWGIYVDLTPPELLTSRQLRLVRKTIVSGLVAVLVLCIGGYFLATRQRSSAEDALAGAQFNTTQLQRQAQKYAGVTQLQATTTQVRAQISSLMTADVDLDALVRRIGAAVPRGVAVDQISVSISQAGVAGSTQDQAAQAAAGATIDDSGHPRIGTVTLSGKATGLNAVSAYVDRLGTITGVLDVVPTSNDSSGGTGQFTIGFGLDDRLLSHRFDAPKGGN